MADTSPDGQSPIATWSKLIESTMKGVSLQDFSEVGDTSVSAGAFLAVIILTAIGREGH